MRPGAIIPRLDRRFYIDNIKWAPLVQTNIHIKI